MTLKDGKAFKLMFPQGDSAQELEKLRREITVLFTDIKGSTAYFEKFGDAAGLMMVNHCNGLMAKAVERHAGQVLKTIGDSLMACFENCTEAVAAAIEMQLVLADDNLSKPEAHRVSVRIGINSGLGIVRANDVYGDVVNVASRVEGAAAPEQIVISHAIYRVIKEEEKFRCRHIGKFSLRGKSSDQDLYEVAWRKQSDTRPAISHNLIVETPEDPALATFKLVQIRSDGRSGKVFELHMEEVTLGRTQGDFVFPHDDVMRERHAKISLNAGQMFVEPIEDAVVLFSLVGPYRLQACDVVKIGAQFFEFHADMDALETAALSGTGIVELSKMLPHPAAEFVALDSEQKSYPLMEDQTTWGRTKATYVFPSDTTMSRSHAKVYYRGEDFFLEDTGSTNGTFVMAKEKTPVPEGVILSIGGQLLRVVREQHVQN